MGVGRRDLLLARTTWCTTRLVVSASIQMSLTGWVVLPRSFMGSLAQRLLVRLGLVLSPTAELSLPALCSPTTIPDLEDVPLAQSSMTKSRSVTLQKMYPGVKTTTRMRKSMLWFKPICGVSYVLSVKETKIQINLSP